MVNPENSPESPDQMTDGSQTISNDDSNNGIIEQSQLTKLAPLEASVAGLASQNDRAFGSIALTHLIPGIISQNRHDLNDVSRTNRDLTTKIESLKDQISQLNRDNGVLNERVQNLKSTRHIRNVAIALGTSLMTFSPTFYVSAEFEWLGLPVVIAGAVLVLVGWLNFSKDGDK